MFVLDKCSHKFCIECLQAYFVEQISSQKVRNMPCPNSECKEPVHQNTFLTLIDEEFVQKFLKIERDLFEVNPNSAEKFVSCPSDGYGVYLDPL